MIYLTDETIDRLIKEDVPYLDLTTDVLGIGNEKGRITFTTREEAVLAGTEEVGRILEKLNLQTVKNSPTGTTVEKGETFLEAQGRAADLHMAWKVSLNILEYCCGIATRTKRLVEKAKKINPELAIVTTRKIFPGTKELSIKAILAGGASPHRLGLSETILIFEQHVNFLGGIDNLAKMLRQIKKKACEKKVIVEVGKREEAEKLAGAGVDGLQFDKVTPAELQAMAEAVRKIDPRIVLIGAGGINENNIQDYAATGIDAVATTGVYFGKPVDIGAKIVNW